LPKRPRRILSFENKKWGERGRIKREKLKITSGKKAKKDLIHLTKGGRRVAKGNSCSRRIQGWYVNGVRRGSWVLES